MVLSTVRFSIASKVALFGAGIFFHGAADHVMTATIGRAPDILSAGSSAGQKWMLAAFDVTITWLLYEIHLWYGRKRELQPYEKPER